MPVEYEFGPHPTLHPTLILVGGAGDLVFRGGMRNGVGAFAVWRGDAPGAVGRIGTPVGEPLVVMEAPTVEVLDAWITVMNHVRASMVARTQPEE